MGHWASTRYVLTLAGIGSIIETQPPADWDFCPVTISEGAKLRFNAIREGTRRLHLVKAGLRRILMTDTAMLCPTFKILST